MDAQKLPCRMDRALILQDSDGIEGASDGESICVCVTDAAAANARVHVQESPGPMPPRGVVSLP